MLREDGVCTAERRDGTGDPRHTGASPARERYTIDSAIEELRCRFGAPKHVAVAQALTGGDDAASDRRRGLSGWRCELLRTRPRHRDHQIEAIEKGP